MGEYVEWLKNKGTEKWFGDVLVSYNVTAAQGGNVLMFNIGSNE